LFLAVLIAKFDETSTNDELKSRLGGSGSSDGSLPLEVYRAGHAYKISVSQHVIADLTWPGLIDQIVKDMRQQGVTGAALGHEGAAGVTMKPMKAMRYHLYNFPDTAGKEVVLEDVKKVCRHRLGGQ
jgi:hypothetical protein